jgi:GT2 family glycosyltransferase
MAPTFSLIIPTFRRPKQLTECLEAVAALDYATDRFEVVVVDDGSREPVDHVIQPFRDRFSVSLLHKTNGGPGSARNAGAAISRGEFLAFTDDDCRPASDWLRKLEVRLRQETNRIVGGRVVNLLSQNPYATTSQIIIDVAYAYYNRNPDDACFFASNNMAVSADLFEKIGGFDIDFRLASEDRELCDRWRHQGYKMSYASEAVVFHAHPLTFRTFCKQHFNYGRGARRFHRVRARRGSGRFLPELKSHAHFLHLLREPLARLPLERAFMTCALLTLWQFVNAAGFFYEGRGSEVGRYRGLWSPML